MRQPLAMALSWQLKVPTLKTSLTPHEIRRCQFRISKLFLFLIASELLWGIENYSDNIEMDRVQTYFPILLKLSWFLQILPLSSNVSIDEFHRIQMIIPLNFNGDRISSEMWYLVATVIIFHLDRNTNRIHLQNHEQLFEINERKVFLLRLVDEKSNSGVVNVQWRPLHRLVNSKCLH